jgi:hypothetical protein
MANNFWKLSANAGNVAVDISNIMLYHEVKKYITSSIMLEMFFVDIIDPRG